MKKKIIAICAALALILTGCTKPANEEPKADTDKPAQNEAKDDAAKSDENKDKPEASEPEVEKVSLGKFNTLLMDQDVHVEASKFLTNEGKLQISLNNVTDKEINKVTVAFVAWDKDKQPVKIQGKADASAEDFVKMVDFDNITIAANGEEPTVLEYELAEGLGIRTFESIVVSAQGKDGLEWTNPLFDSWKQTYEGKEFDIHMEFDYKAEEK